jgi:hypothetical protein
MKHLSRAEFVDLIESSPTLTSDRIRHLEACEACRAEADALRTVRALAQTDEAAEPSPLFWDHFAARVADAVRRETPPVRSADGMRSLRAPLVTWAAGAMIAVLVITTAVWRTTLHAPAPATAQAGSPTSSIPVRPGGHAVNDVDDPDADEAWAVVRVAAVDLRWEDAQAAGISAHPGAVEEIALELTGDERSELTRLLEEDLKPNGV